MIICLASRSLPVSAQPSGGCLTCCLYTTRFRSECACSAAWDWQSLPFIIEAQPGSFKVVHAYVSYSPGGLCPGGRASVAFAGEFRSASLRGARGDSVVCGAFVEYASSVVVAAVCQTLEAGEVSAEYAVSDPVADHQESVAEGNLLREVHGAPARFRVLLLLFLRGPTLSCFRELKRRASVFFLSLLLRRTVSLAENQIWSRIQGLGEDMILPPILPRKSLEGRLLCVPEAVGDAAGGLDRGTVVAEGDLRERLGVADVREDAEVEELEGARDGHGPAHVARDRVAEELRDRPRAHALRLGRALSRKKKGKKLREGSFSSTSRNGASQRTHPRFPQTKPPTTHTRKNSTQNPKTTQEQQKGSGTPAWLAEVVGLAAAHESRQKLALLRGDLPNRDFRKRANKKCPSFRAVRFWSFQESDADF